MIIAALVIQKKPEKGYIGFLITHTEPNGSVRDWAWCSDGDTIDEALAILWDAMARYPEHQPGRIEIRTRGFGLPTDIDDAYFQHLFRDGVGPYSTEKRRIY